GGAHGVDEAAVRGRVAGDDRGPARVALGRRLHGGVGWLVHGAAGVRGTATILEMGTGSGYPGLAVKFSARRLHPALRNVKLNRCAPRSGGSPSASGSTP